jgi:hypothetical protein
MSITLVALVFFLSLLFKPLRVIVGVVVGTVFNILGALVMFLGMFITVSSGLLIKIGQYLREGH